MPALSAFPGSAAHSECPVPASPGLAPCWHRALRPATTRVCSLLSRLPRALSLWQDQLLTQQLLRSAPAVLILTTSSVNINIFVLEADEAASETQPGSQTPGQAAQSQGKFNEKVKQTGGKKSLGGENRPWRRGELEWSGGKAGREAAHTGAGQAWERSETRRAGTSRDSHQNWSRLLGFPIFELFPLNPTRLTVTKSLCWAH